MPFVFVRLFIFVLFMRGKKIIVGVTGSIAAYKTALLVRLLVKAGAEVRVVMTPAAGDFITPVTLAALSGHPVLSSFYEDHTGSWHNHVDLGLWGDAMVIAPASANTLARCAAGICDEFLLAVYLSARCPVFFAPAMDLDMYAHPATQQNLQKLAGFGNRIIDPGVGELASGLTGVGRMAEPGQIFEVLEAHFGHVPAAAGKRVLITAGPTVEAIDPVRFISNHSSGKMGYALAAVFAKAGAEVTLVSGPVSLPAPYGVNRISVDSAESMYVQTEKHFDRSDLVIFAAAVADYTPVAPSDRKIKKKEELLELRLGETKDIAALLGARKHAGQLLVGFALETDNELEHARKKRESKNLDYIVLNSLRDPGAGFAYDTNKITVIDREGTARYFELKPKPETAADIFNIILENWNDQ